jgi:DNA-binding MarR family transcriptional regulator
MTDTDDTLAVALFSEILMTEQLARTRIGRALPKGMELSQFSTLNHLARAGEERTPAQLARAFHVTKGAMTNTLTKLERAGYVHIRPDWNDARKKRVAISPAGRSARDAAIAAVVPLIRDVANRVGMDRIRTALPILRELREDLGSES